MLGKARVCQARGSAFVRCLSFALLRARLLKLFNPKETRKMATLWRAHLAMPRAFIFVARLLSDFLEELEVTYDGKYVLWLEGGRVVYVNVSPRCSLKMPFSPPCSLICPGCDLTNFFCRWRITLGHLDVVQHSSLEQGFPALFLESCCPVCFHSNPKIAYLF